MMSALSPEVPSQRGDALSSVPLALRFPPYLESALRADFFKNSLPMMRIALVLAAVLYALFGILDRWIVPTVMHQIWFIRFAVVIPFLVATLACTFHAVFRRWAQPVLFAAALVTGGGIVAMVAIASETEGATYYAGLILVIVWAYTLLRLQFFHATTVGWLLLVAYEVVAVAIRPVTLPILLNNTFFFASANIIGMLGCYYLERYLRRDFLQRRIIEVEREKAETLLLNILPSAIAERLKHDQHAIAEGFGDATVMFADIVDFTRLSAGMPPLELVHLLNGIFTAVDALVEKHGLEKIKTIGDAYMVVGGLPLRRSDHAEAIADLALDLQRTIGQFHGHDSKPIAMRIGINSGPVIAGVIGTKKFIYDLWGDAVNTASRMESHGVAGQIQVTESTYQRLRDRYQLECRGTIEVKGKGPLVAWLLHGRAAE